MASSQSKVLFGTKCLPVENGVCKATVWIHRSLPTLLLAIGTVGNIVNIFVLSRKKLRVTPCFLLVFLSLFDIFCLWSLYLQTPFRLGFGIDVKASSDTYCKMHTWMSVCSGAASVWTVAIFTIERMIFVLFPHNTAIHLNRNKSIVIMAGIVVVIAAMLGVVLGGNWSADDNRPGDDSWSVARNWSSYGNWSADDNSSADGNWSFDSNWSVDDNWPAYSNWSSDGKWSVANWKTWGFWYAKDNWSIDSNLSVNGNFSDDDNLSFGSYWKTEGNWSAEGNWSTNGATGNGTINVKESQCSLNGFDNESGPTNWQVLILLLCTIIPFFIVIAGNITLLVHLFKRRRAGTAIDKQTTLLLIVIGLMFCTLGPFGIFVVTFQILSTYLDKSYPVSELTYALIYTLVMCNHSLNFICYAWKGTLFKRECKAIWQEIKTFACTCE